MSLKDSKTVTNYIEFDRALNVARELLKDPKSKIMGLYILVSIHTGLRIGDVKSLQWEQLRSDSFTITEQKTKKERIITVHENIKKALKQFDTKNGIVFKSQKGSIYTSQQLNRKLKTVFNREVKKGDNISSHSLRKTFGRRVWENNNQSESALIYLSELFNHTSLSVTRLYLGIRQQELSNIYLSL